LFNSLIKVDLTLSTLEPNPQLEQICVSNLIEFPFELDAFNTPSSLDADPPIFI